MGRPREEFGKDELRMLAFLRDAAPGPRSAAVASNAQIARALGCSEAKVKILKRSLLDKGLLETQERFADNGGQLESAYRLTRKGRRALAAHTDELEAISQT